MLWRQYGTRIAKGRFKLLGGREVALSDNVQKVLKFNFMLRRVQAFFPTNETERDILCHIWKIENPHLIYIEPHSKPNNGFAVEMLNNLAASTEKQDLEVALKENHLAIFRQGIEYYCVDFTHKCIFNLASEGIDFKALLPALQELQPMPVQDSHHSNNILNNVLSQQTATSDRNAEWEVGGNGDYEVDGEWKLRRS
jgi:relaxase/mobilization nuclease domain protein